MSSVTFGKCSELERVWIYDLIGHWKWDDVFRHLQTEAIEVGTDKQRYDVIGEMRKSADIPNFTMGNFRTVLQRRATYGGRLSILISKNMLVKALERTFRVAFPNEGKNLYVVSTLEEAYDLIRTDRTK